ncbi:AraC family transcriptional regulator [Chitinophaga silvatica]|uniref:AraC family transcriptional regulator n=1 Tax=Chitinophaga silvatica TaxID=2282649 RepID=A0A3E1Y4D9_9BACT|nr:AraC family transcriptional regulator [Chitinophaga silvatica]RFS19506.1 AraC family transcriptional regulator [Chitinophaga silvatica]
MKEIKKKYLLANRNDQLHINLEKIPVYLHSALMPYAKYYSDIDINGIILDQKIKFREFSIYYHLIHLSEGTKLTSIITDKDIVPACISGFYSHTEEMPLKISLPTHPQLTAAFPVREYIMDFHVNFDSFYLFDIIDKFPLFKILNPKVEFNHNEIHSFTPPPHPYQTNKVNYNIMKRIINCKLVGDLAEKYLYRNALNYFLTYLHYLLTPAPIMLHGTYVTQLMEIADYILQNPVEAKSKEALCKKFEVVPEFLEEPFQQMFYTPVDDLIYQERMNIAFKLLTEEQHTFTYVANKTGFPDYETLKKEFQEYYRCNLNFFLNVQ